MHRTITRSILLLVVLFQLATTSHAVTRIEAELDARELTRQLLHCKMEIPVKPGTVHIRYPQWIPGIHAPYGPVQNVAGLRLETPKGTRIEWKRDPLQLYRIACTVPRGVKKLIVKLDYICNQPTVNSTGVDSFGTSQIGIINWNTCLVYPENATVDELQVALKLRLPEGWGYGTALKTDSVENGWVSFKPERMRTVVDSPLLTGEHFRSITLPTKNVPPTYIHLTSESQSALQWEEDLIQGFGNLMNESGALFGAGHFEEYHFLLSCSDTLPALGLEHLASSLNGIGQRDLIDKENRFGWSTYLLPHELVHSWCGKHRLPAPMFTTDFHTPKETSLLWVYEGLTTYLGELLTVRSGLITMDEYLGTLADKIDRLMRHKGREWRSLEDTATASYQLRARSPHWGHLRRSQDYYHEGLLIWLEADILIRQATNGEKSLNDFCKEFMGPPAAPGTIRPYEVDEVLSILNKLADHDWEQFIHDRVMSTQKELSLEFVNKAGYRLEYHTEPTPLVKRREKKGTVSAIGSIGCTVSSAGKIGSVIPGMAADEAKLSSGMVIHGVNGFKFTTQRLKDAIAESVTRRSVDLLILDGDRFDNRSIQYSGGTKYLRLVRDSKKPDLLGEIFKPMLKD